MFSHVMVGSNDIERSKRFYDAVLSVLGLAEPIRNVSPTGHTRLFYRHDGQSFCVTEPINGEPARFANGGTSIEAPPGPRQGSLEALYLAYVREPDGNKLCAMYRVHKPS